MTDKLLLFILIFLMPHLGYGQINEYDFKRQQLKGYKRVIEVNIHYTHYTNPLDSLISETIYYINPEGAISKCEYFNYEKSLEMWTTFKYNLKGQLIEQETHSQDQVNDEKIEENRAAWKEGSYYGNIYTYSAGKLIKELAYLCIEGSKTYTDVHFHEYDKKGRKTKTTHVDLLTGIRGKFQPNSDMLKSVYLKTDSTTSHTVYRYTLDSILATRRDYDGKVSYDYTLTNAKGLPIKTEERDGEGNPLMIYTFVYDKQDRLLERKRIFIDEKKIDMIIVRKIIARDGMTAMDFPIRL